MSSHALRQKAAGSLLEEYPDHYPVLVKFDSRAILKYGLREKKVMTCGEINLRAFTSQIRKEIQIGQTDLFSLIIESGGTIVGDEKMGDLYECFKKEDGFLHVLFMGDI